jgi:3-oxoacyl-[acyl-carrier-protein] synthase II
MSDAREAWITGIGIVSCLGEGPDAHWQALSEGAVNADAEGFAPYVVHRVVPLDLDKQIPKKGDQRQMEPWLRIGTYAAGLALDSAGVKGNNELLSRMDMIVAAGGGERDLNVDVSILSGLPGAPNPAAFLNQRLTNDLRPTLFLAQLSNLMAGNISIVHNVTGSSRTFMGEEAAGVDAVRVSLARIAAGQSDIALVGGAYNAERLDIILHYLVDGCLWQGEPAGIWERAAKGGGMALGSMGAFLVLEEKSHAEKRGAKPFARISSVLSEQSRRNDGDIAKTLETLWTKLPASSGAAVISGATGLEPATSEERAFLASKPDLAVRATGTHVGQGLEPTFVLNIALAAMSLRHGSLFPSADRSGMERDVAGALTQVVVTSVGHWRGEGLALVESAS